MPKKKSKKLKGKYICEPNKEKWDMVLKFTTKHLKEKLGRKNQSKGQNKNQRLNPMKRQKIKTSGL